MSMTDPIADLLTRIRNAQQAGHPHLVVPRSKLKLALIAILKQEGFVEGYVEQEGGPQGAIKVFLRYDAANRGIRTPPTGIDPATSGSPGGAITSTLPVCR